MKTKKQTSDGLWFFEYKDQNADNSKLPIYVFLHGSGERGPSDGSQLGKVENQGTPKLMKQAGRDFLPGFVTLAPQQTSNYYGWIGGQAITKFLKWVRTNYQFDGRIFVSGLSMGGDGCWEGSYHSSGYEDLITAFAPVSSLDGDYKSAKNVTAAYHTPVWAIHGNNDSPDLGKKPVNGMNEAQANPAPIWTTFPGGHNSSFWDIAFSLTPRPELGNTTIYDWFLTQGVVVPPVPGPVEDIILRSYYDGTHLVSITQAGKTIKVLPTSVEKSLSS